MTCDFSDMHRSGWDFNLGRLFVVATPKAQYLGLNHYDLH